jgi:SdrD B-like domain
VGLNAAAGRTGLFNGVDLAGFEPSGGSIASAGGQFRLTTSAAGAPGSGTTDAAFQLVNGQNITDGAGFGTTQNTRGFWAAMAWEGVAPWAEGLAPGYARVQERQGGLRVQGNVARSTAFGDSRATGAWADASWRTERWRNAAGLFRFEPELRWGTALLASDIQGIYLQADTSTRQWQAGYAAEFSDSVSHVSGTSARSAFVNLNGRYRLDTRNTLGAALSARALTSPGEALQLTWDQTTNWGQTQWRGDFAHTGAGRSTRTSIDQSWPVGFPNSLNTSLAWERTSGDTAPGTSWIWGVLGTFSPHAQWSLDAALRGARRSDGAQSLNANIGMRWQPTPNWSLALRYTQARGQDPLTPLVVSALTAATLPTPIATPASQSLQLVLRYEESAGRSSAPLGGTVGSGAGSLSGSVYFDADGNGRREASEGGVPGVTVILDRRFVTRTDAQGRYEFPAVAAGEHVIEVSSDNVPLPWSPALRDPVKVRLYVRQFTTQDFAVQRDR